MIPTIIFPDTPESIKFRRLGCRLFGNPAYAAKKPSSPKGGNMASCSWPLGNGETLSFEVYGSNEGWNKVAGLYLFSYLGTNGLWQALYVGQTDDFSSRLPSHERLDEAVRLGATHIHTAVVTRHSDRDRWEKMLIQTLQPPLNEQLKGYVVGLPKR